MGGDVDEHADKDIAAAKKDAEERLKNPLKDFPYDIEYLSAHACRQKIEISQRFKGRMAKNKVWDNFRMGACLGKHGIVAKRCSMNDVLWGRYLKYGDKLTLEDIKRMILFDAKRRELYPPDYRGDGEEPPPVEYLEQLKREGRLDKIYNELDEIGRV